jgi:hypothetical protein
MMATAIAMAAHEVNGAIRYFMFAPSACSRTEPAETIKAAATAAA